MRANKSANRLRIIGGSWRGRKIPFASLPGLRPTPDRVRETLFNWLAPDIQGARCLDLFAGSGALGLEAASRGAACVVMVDQSPVVAKALREQAGLLDAKQLRIVEANALHWLQGGAEPFDIVFLDPPFQDQLLQPAIELLAEKDWLSAGAWVYLESAKGAMPELPDGWSVHREKQAGKVSFCLVNAI